MITMTYYLMKRMIIPCRDTYTYGMGLLVLCSLGRSAARLCHLSNPLIDVRELPGPTGAVKDLPLVVTVIIWRIVLGMARWSDGCHLVPVDCIIRKETLHL